LGIFIIIRCLICFYLLTSDLLNEFESLTLNLHILLFFSYKVCFINKPLPVDTQRLVRKYSEGTGSKPKSVNKVAVEITDTETNTISTFESIRKAAKAINSDVKSLTRYEKYLSGCGKNPVLYRNKYSVVFKRLNLNSTKPVPPGRSPGGTYINTLPIVPYKVWENADKKKLEIRARVAGTHFFPPGRNTSGKQR
jgi:hypothetical protein